MRYLEPEPVKGRPPPAADPIVLLGPEEAITALLERYRVMKGL